MGTPPWEPGQKPLLMGWTRLALWSPQPGLARANKTVTPLKGALQSTPLRGDTEQTGASAQSVLRQAVTPNPYLGGGSMIAINPVRA